MSNKPDTDLRVKALGHYTMIYNWKVVDQGQNIYQGFPVLQEGMPEEEEGRVLFFSRDYHPETSDLDKIFPEVEIKEASIIGCKFLLVSKEKLLLGWRPKSSTILRPPTRSVGRGGGRGPRIAGH